MKKSLKYVIRQIVELVLAEICKKHWLKTSSNDGFLIWAKHKMLCICSKNGVFYTFTLNGAHSCQVQITIIRVIESMNFSAKGNTELFKWLASCSSSSESTQALVQGIESQLHRFR